MFLITIFLLWISVPSENMAAHVVIHIILFQNKYSKTNSVRLFRRNVLNLPENCHFLSKLQSQINLNCTYTYTERILKYRKHG